MTTAAAGHAGEPTRAHPIRLYLLDDHEMVRAGLANLLTATGDFVVVGQSGTVADARREILQLVPDVALLDVRLPDGSGIELCRDVRSADPAIRCVLLTSFDESNAAAAAVLAGASGYFLKEIRTVDLAAALRTVAAGGSVIDPLLSQAAIDALSRDYLADPATGGLTRREAEIRDLLLQGMTNREIAEKLHMPERSVRAYVSTIIGKVTSPL